MAKKKRKNIDMRCPYCGRSVQLRKAAYVYGENAICPDDYLYVCNGYPENCDAYVRAHRETLRPMGTLANSELRNLRIQAHRALSEVWETGCMTKHGAYIWLQNRLNLRQQDTHIGMFSEYYCKKTIEECLTQVQFFENIGKEIKKT